MKNAFAFNISWNSVMDTIISLMFAYETFPQSLLYIGDAGFSEPQYLYTLHINFCAVCFELFPLFSLFVLG